MKNKVLIIQAHYYKDISTALLKSAKKELKSFSATGHRHYPTKSDWCSTQARVLGASL